MKQSKKCIKWKYKLLAVSLFVVLLLSYTFYECNRLLEPVMIAVAKQEVQSSLNKLIHNCISVLDFNPDDLIRVKTNDEGEIISVNYDSMKLNQLLYKAVESINESLLLAQKGEVDPITNQVYFDNGVVDEVPLGYFTEMVGLSDMGPKIKIRVKVINRVNGVYEIMNEAYGINNTLLKIMIRVNVKADVFAGISQDEIIMQEEIPVIIQLINGNVPQFLPALTQQ